MDRTAAARGCGNGFQQRRFSVRVLAFGFVIVLYMPETAAQRGPAFGKFGILRMGRARVCPDNAAVYSVQLHMRASYRLGRSQGQARGEQVLDNTFVRGQPRSAGIV